MRTVEILPAAEQELRFRAGTLANLGLKLRVEIEDALSDRKDLESVWKEAQRLYSAVPQETVRDTPVEGSPAIEVPLAGIASDSIYASMADLIHNVQPPLTARAGGARWEPNARAVRRLVNRIASQELNLRENVDHVLLDNVIRGTGVFYVPWTKRILMTGVNRVLWEGPELVPVPVEDFLVPSGTGGDIQKARWIAVRSWRTRGEMELRRVHRGWDTARASPTSMTSDVTEHRERASHLWGSRDQEALFEIWEVFMQWDRDGDGKELSLLVAWDRTSGSVLHARWVPYDQRPFTAMRYQLRPHLFWGIGVPEMIASLQAEISAIHNNRVLNSLLVNSRVWLRNPSAGTGDIAIYPGAIIDSTDPTGLVPLPMADVFPSAFNDESFSLGLAERRTGVNDLSLPKQSALSTSRTPATTAALLNSSVNRRFAPAFDGAARAIGDAVLQALYRYQEKLLLGDGTSRKIEEHIADLLGPKDAALVLEVLARPDFDQEISVELTASSATINREAERGQLLQAFDIWSRYAEGVMGLIPMATNPGVDPVVREVAGKVIARAGDLVQKILERFDALRDAETLRVEVPGGENVAQSGPPSNPAAVALSQLGPLLGMGGNGR